MDLTAADIKPAEGKVALLFVDDLDDDGDIESDVDVDNDGLIAIVRGVGSGVTGVKVGDTVVTSPWARDGLCIGENLHICDAWCIAGTVK